MTVKLSTETIKIYLKWLKKPNSLYMTATHICVDSRGRESLVEIQLPALPLTDQPQRRKSHPAPPPPES